MNSKVQVTVKVRVSDSNIMTNSSMHNNTITGTANLSNRVIVTMEVAIVTKQRQRQ